MTYQLTLRGRDGIVLASDQCEYSESDNGETGVSNRLRKISFRGRFAWAYWGGALGPLFSAILEESLARSGDIPDDSIRQMLNQCAETTQSHYRNSPTGTTGPSHVILVCGDSRKIFQAKLNIPPMDIREFGPDAPCITGLSPNLASFLPKHFYSEAMSTERLATLAAYSILEAHVLSPTFVDGLDVAVYREGQWKFEDRVKLEKDVAELEQSIRKLIAG